MKAKLAPERAASREAREPFGLERRGCLGLPIGHAKERLFGEDHRSRKSGCDGLVFLCLGGPVVRSLVLAALVVIRRAVLASARLTHHRPPLKLHHMIARQLQRVFRRYPISLLP